jgi:phosphate transport system protein
MSLKLPERIETIKKRILTLGGLVEEAVSDAIRAVEDRCPELAERVIASDVIIDKKEVELEETCLEVLTLAQPVAFDLRFVVAVLKMNNDLERIGDLAANIAEQAKLLCEEGQLQRVPFDLRGMQMRAQAMLKQSLDALVYLDTDLAEIVCDADDRVDEIFRRTFDAVEEEVQRNPQHAQQLIHFLTIARMLERMADHAVNIAEDVLYLESGKIRRHRGSSQVA